MCVLTILAFLYAWHPEIDAQLVMLSLIASTLYDEIAAKLFYRWKL